MGFLTDATGPTAPRTTTPLARPAPLPQDAAAVDVARMFADQQATQHAPAAAPSTGELVDRARAAQAEQPGVAAPSSEGFLDFGHKTGLTLSLIQRQPLWKDDRTHLTPEQWAAMPPAQQDAILAMMPDDLCRKVHLSHMDPEVVQARTAVKQVAGAAARGLWKFLESRQPPPPQN